MNNGYFMCRSKVNRLHRRGLIILVIIPSQYSTPLSPTTPDIVCSPRYCTLSNASIPNGVSLQDNSELHVKSLDVAPVSPLHDGPRPHGLLYRSSLQLLDSVHHLAFMRQVMPIEDLEKPNFYEASFERGNECIKMFNVFQIMQTNIMVDETTE